MFIMITLISYLVNRFWWNLYISTKSSARRQKVLRSFSLFCVYCCPIQGRMNGLFPLSLSSHRGERLRRYSTSWVTVFTIHSASCGVLYLLRVRRREPRAISRLRPRARSTWLGSKEPEVQAEPEEAQMPCLSSMRRRLSPSTPSKQKLTFPERRL